MIDALVAALRRAEKEAAAIVLAGRAERFCAGFDMRVMMSGRDAAVALLRHGVELLLGFYDTPLPVVVACSGHALAGGALLALTGDVRLGAAGAFKIGLNEVAIGIPIPMLAMEFARDRLSPLELTRATLFAQIYAPDEAVAAGYLDRVVPASDSSRRSARSRPPRRPQPHRLRRHQAPPPPPHRRPHPRRPGLRHGPPDDLTIDASRALLLLTTLAHADTAVPCAPETPSRARRLERRSSSARLVLPKPSLDVLPRLARGHAPEPVEHFDVVARGRARAVGLFRLGRRVRPRPAPPNGPRWRVLSVTSGGMPISPPKFDYEPTVDRTSRGCTGSARRHGGPASRAARHQRARLEEHAAKRRLRRLLTPR